MASSKDTFEPGSYLQWSFASGAFRGIGITSANYFFRPLTGPSKETYTLIGQPKGLPVVGGVDQDEIELVGP